MKNITLPKNYMIARYIHLTGKLSELPAVTRGVHKGGLVYRVRSGGRIRIFKESSENGVKAGEIYRLRERITAMLNGLRSSFEDIDTVASAFRIERYKELKLGSDFYRNAVQDSSPYRNRNKYVLNGVNYRSRVELMIAQVLTDLGLEFKYDCDISCSGITYTVDFLVYLPEFGRCFMIEYLGRLDDEGYVHKNSIKIRDYLSNGYYFGTDLLILCGNEFQMPTVGQIRGEILHMLDTISSAHLTRENAFVF